LSQQIITYPASKRSSLEVFEEFHFLTNWNTIQQNGFCLPGTKEERDFCGLWQTKGCLNEKAHRRLGFGNKIFVKQYQRSCFRAVCKICYRKWMGRQANKATRRIEKYEELTGKNVKHIIVSPPSWLYSKDVKELKKEMYRILKEVGCVGGASLFHPFRFNKETRCWYFAPHFHVMGFGWIVGVNVSDVYKKNGWIVKNKGFRDSIFQTFYYQLSHCGIKKHFHSLIWFGDLSYRKLKIEKEPDSNVCPACDDKLVPIYHDGVHSGIPPEETFEDFVDPFDWYEVETIPKSEWTKQDRYNYALERELHDANKGISY